jgi:hypothetical protein
LTSLRQILSGQPDRPVDRDLGEFFNRHGQNADFVQIKAPSAGLITLGDNPDDNRTVMSILITLWVAILTTIHPLAEAFADIPPERRFTVKAWMTGERELPRTMIFQKSPDFPELSALLGSFLAERVAAAADPDRWPRTGGFTRRVAPQVHMVQASRTNALVVCQFLR